MHVIETSMTTTHSGAIERIVVVIDGKVVFDSKNATEAQHSTRAATRRHLEETVAALNDAGSTDAARAARHERDLAIDAAFNAGWLNATIGEICGLEKRSISAIRRRLRQER